jgi:glycosyltransferase involved in cell wall biosynthesis
MEVLENGYDEEAFVGAVNAGQTQRSLNPGAITLLHSGIVYPSERDPTALFVALAQLKCRGEIQPGQLIVRFRASVHEDLMRKLAASHAVEPFIELCPPIPYREALAEMLRADGLLVMQASNCNEQIPAKIYEYLRAGRPILGLTDRTGDTGSVLRNAGIEQIASLDSPEEIAALILTVTRGERRALLPAADAVAAASRYGRTQVFAGFLEEIARPSCE